MVRKKPAPERRPGSRAGSPSGSGTGPGPGTVRIIAGTWRGRRLPVPEVPGLRPSGDRARETLFNWLRPHLAGARCIDLFAGTGVLGLEAVSRGAAQAVLVEQAPRAAAAIRASLEALNADHVRLVEAEALAWLAAQQARSADLVFVDPPFDSGLASRALDALFVGRVVAPGGRVYLESPRTQPARAPAPGWSLERGLVVGEVRLQVFRRAESVAG